MDRHPEPVYAGFLRRVRDPTVDEMAERVVKQQGATYKDRVLLWQVEKKRFAALLDRNAPCQ